MTPSLMCRPIEDCIDLALIFYLYLPYHAKKSASVDVGAGMLSFALVNICVINDVKCFEISNFLLKRH